VVNLPQRRERGTPREDILALLFAADRLDHLENEILPCLEEGTHVISDRYYLSSFAYQTLDGSLELEWVWHVNSRCLRPDLTLFLDVAPAECKRRMEARGRHVELYEELPKLELVRQSYLRAIQHLTARGETIKVVDGSRPIEAVHGELEALVRPLVGAAYQV
jgi:dTMP kinase